MQFRHSLCRAINKLLQLQRQQVERERERERASERVRKRPAVATKAGGTCAAITTKKTQISVQAMFVHWFGLTDSLGDHLSLHVAWKDSGDPHDVWPWPCSRAHRSIAPSLKKNKQVLDASFPFRDNRPVSSFLPTSTGVRLLSSNLSNVNVYARIATTTDTHARSYVTSRHLDTDEEVVRDMTTRGT